MWCLHKAVAQNTLRLLTEHLSSNAEVPTTWCQQASWRGNKSTIYAAGIWTVRFLMTHIMADMMTTAGNTFVGMNWLVVMWSHCCVQAWMVETGSGLADRHSWSEVIDGSWRSTQRRWWLRWGLYLDKSIMLNRTSYEYHFHSLCNNVVSVVKAVDSHPGQPTFSICSNLYELLVVLDKLQAEFILTTGRVWALELGSVGH